MGACCESREKVETPSGYMACMEKRKEISDLIVGRSLIEISPEYQKALLKCL